MDLRPVGDDEFPAWARMVERSFGGVLSDEAVAGYRSLVELDRTLAVVDGDELVGGAASLSTTLTLPGGAVPAAAVTAVAVRGTHRRRGMLRAMMRRQLDGVTEPVAVLTASEAAIYGRFGYGLGAQAWACMVPTLGLALGEPPAVPGRLRDADPAERRDACRAAHELAAAGRPGELRRPSAWWDLWAAGHDDLDDPDAGADRPRFLVVHEDAAGAVDGFAVWRTRPHEGGDAGVDGLAVRVEQLVAADPAVEAALWHHVLSLDLVRVVHATVAPETPLRWRLADPRRVAASVVDHLWVRVLDPAAALAGRTYGTDDRFVLEIDEPFPPGIAGRWLLEGGPDGARCERVDRPDPDLRLGAADLGALLLGGVSPSVLAAAGRVVPIGGPGVLRRADAFFTSGTPPFCSWDF